MGARVTCLLESLGNVKDAARVGARRRVDCRNRVGGDECIRRRRRGHYRNEHWNTRAADAACTALGARVGSGASCVLDAFVGDHAGQEIGGLHRKGGEPHGEEKPHHGSTIPRGLVPAAEVSRPSYGSGA